VKITFIGHAALLVEVGSIKIISDPWWSGPCFGVQWWLYPPPDLDCLKKGVPDYIYISHGHSDHLHPGTLRRLPKSARVLVSRPWEIGDAIKRLGFEVISLKSEQQTELAPGVKVEIIDSYGSDTIMVITDGEETFVNANDALHVASTPLQDRIISHIQNIYGKVDYLYLGYGTASHFPNCYSIPGKDNTGSAIKRQSYFNGNWASIVARLGPRYAFPFAADVVLLDDDLMWSNEPVRNADRPTDRFRQLHPNSSSIVYDIAPGFTIADGQVTQERLFQPISASSLRSEMADEIRTANTITAPTDQQVEDLAGSIRENVALCSRYLAEFSTDYRILVLLKGRGRGICVRKENANMTVEVIAEPIDCSQFDLVFMTRFSYLRRALATLYGHEVIIVGSGGKWQYRTREAAATNLHEELAVMIRNRTGPPRSRFGDQPRWVYELKMMVKRLLGIPTKDLYELMEWTVFEETRM
jgi:L-ascorbate metabolism protein UlaG (beta-lactamase superfamily)